MFAPAAQVVALAQWVLYVLINIYYLALCAASAWMLRCVRRRRCATTTSEHNMSSRALGSQPCGEQCRCLCIIMCSFFFWEDRVGSGREAPWSISPCGDLVRGCLASRCPGPPVAATPEELIGHLVTICIVTFCVRAGPRRLDAQRYPHSRSLARTPAAPHTVVEQYIIHV